MGTSVPPTPHLSFTQWGGGDGGDRKVTAKESGGRAFLGKMFDFRLPSFFCILLWEQKTEGTENERQTTQGSGNGVRGSKKIVPAGFLRNTVLVNLS